MAQVRLLDVWKTYEGGVDAVRGFTLDIADGEFVVFVGPSGCGKSTTLRMIAGLEEISRGEILIGDRVVNDVHPKDRDIAMVFQNYALYPHMSVYQNMAFALKLRKVPRTEIDRRVREAARTLGIEHLLDRKPRALSGGQRQRVAVGRAIVREPKCFLFDEPLSNLDAKLRVTTRGELKALHQRLRTTTVYVTHDQEEAMTLGDRVVVMSEGLIQQADAPLNVFRHPVNRFVAGFIGTPPMNFFEGSAELVGEGVVFTLADRAWGGGEIRLRVHAAHTASLREAVQTGRGASLVLGVRPSALSEAAVGEAQSRAAAEGRLIPARVALVEPLGDQMDLHLTLAGGRGFTARVPAHGFNPPGRDTALAVDTSQCHYFEPGEFGVNLVARQLEPEPMTA